MQYKLIAMGLGLCGAGAPAMGATITWGAAHELVSDADLDLTNPVVYAINAGDTTNNPAIYNGTPPNSPLLLTRTDGKTVSFDGVEGKYGVGSTFGSTTSGDAIDHLSGQSYNVTFSTTGSRTTSIPQVSLDKLSTTSAADGQTYAVATGNAVLDAVLNSQVYVDGRGIGTSALNISLNNLIPGTAYQVQIIGAADSRTGANSPSVSTLNDGGTGSVAGLSGFVDLDGLGSAHVTTVLGTFIADGTSQSINAVLEAKRNNGISALILTSVPEPGSMALASLAGLALLRRRNRNRIGR